MIWAKSAGALASAGASGLLGLLLLTEAGVPVPIPADLLMIVLGERVSAGAISLGIALLALQAIAVLGTLFLYWAARGPGRAILARVGPRIGLTGARLERVHNALERRGLSALALGRSTPGLRTVTVVAAAGSSLAARPTLLALFIGSTVFVQGHFLLGLVLGPAAREALERAGAFTVSLVALLLVAGAAMWMVKRRSRTGLQSWSEAGCPACLALGALTDRRGRIDGP